ncbi:MAG: hypothetical protein OEY14_09970, partial [Myxococcales bacterium]|nr:hypothetical protein [Myxococcales bacterium]
MSVRALGSRLQLALPRLEELHAQAAPALPPERLRLMLAPRPISRARWPSAAPLFEDRLEPREGEAAIELLPRLGSIQALGAAASSLPAPIRDALG